MSSTNRARITIEQPGKPQFYQHQSLPGWEFVGVVARGDDKGALVRNTNTGKYAMANAGAISTLDQRKVLSALSGSNATKMADGGRRNVYMSDADVERARRLGNGNISEGIRVALGAQRETTMDA